MSITVLDCTFRDGGYYNSWDFSPELVNAYLQAMKAARVDVVELGFRFVARSGFKGAAGYTTDEYLERLDIPKGLTVAVMVNGSDLLGRVGLEEALENLFPRPASQTPLELVRFACHHHEFEKILPAAAWLSERGYRVGVNLMQIADRSREEVVKLARSAGRWPIEVLYFADSMGSMSPDDTARIIGWIREEWSGPVGIHTHDNMGLALANTLRAAAEGATWLDATVTGMGRGPGNARTEELVIEVDAMGGRNANLVPLTALIRRYFGPLKVECGWGTNSFYYLCGKYGIHPTYVQEMLADRRYDEEDIFAVIDYLRNNGGKKFNSSAVAAALDFYTGEPQGSWSPAELMEGREVLILGTGPGVVRHRSALESYIRRARPLVLALNTQTGIASELIDLRVACHPVRLLADVDDHLRLPQPLITPASSLPAPLRHALQGKELLDFGLGVERGTFAFHDRHCQAPSSLVLGYALGVVTSGRAERIMMAGFDGYPAGDARNGETEELLRSYKASGSGRDLISIAPTSYDLPTLSLYAL